MANRFRPVAPLAARGTSSTKILYRTRPVDAQAMTLLLVYALGALLISFFCSLLEAALLSTPVATLAERAGDNDAKAARLLEIKEHRLDDGISAILTLNTLANTIGAALAGAQAAVVFGDQRWGWITAVGLFTASLTAGVLLFSEIIPKTLGAVHGRSWYGFVGGALTVLLTALKPALVITRSLTRLLTPDGLRAGVSRNELAAMVSMAADDGALAASESRTLASVLQTDQIAVDDVMTPRTVVTMLPETTTVGTFLSDENNRVYSRIPLYENTRDDVTGFVLQRDVLIAAASGMDPETTLAQFARTALFLPEGQSVGRALRRMIEKREHLAMVTDEYGGIRGLVTLEDLVETTLGVEILDESDRVADLRAEAVRLRERRLAHMRQWRSRLDQATSGTWSGASAKPNPERGDITQSSSADRSE